MFNKIKRMLTVALSCIAVAATMAGIGLFNVTLTKAEVSEAQTMLTSGNLAVTKASVKYKLSEEDQTAGIKFLVEMDKSVYESSVDVENSNVKIGVLIIPEYVMQHNSETELTLGTTWVNNAVLYDGAAETPVNAFNVSETDDTKVEAVAYLYGQPETHYDKTLKVRAYLSTSESDVVYSSVLSPVLSEVAYEARKALSESAQDYEAKYTELSKYVKPKAIKSLDDFVAIYANEESLSREYKLETDIAFTSTSLYDLITAAGGINNINNAVFTGTLDGNGHKITGTGDDARLFSSVSGTIKNLIVSGSYGVWGGALGELLAAGGVIDNVKIDATLRDTRAFGNNSDWNERSMGGMFNYISGTVTNSVVHVTLPANITKTNGLPITNMSAIGQVSGSATVTNCQAFLTNNATSDTIHSVFQMANEPAVVSTKLELCTGNTYQLPAATAYVSSNSDVATVSESGLITAVSGGVATVTATVGGLEVPFTVSILNEIATLDDLVGVYASTETLAGSYKLTADIAFTSTSLDNLITAAGGINNINNAVFTGTLDGNGHKITGNGARLFLSVTGTIKNLTVSGSYGVWGGALGELLAVGGVIDNVKIDATLRDTCAFNNNSDWYARSMGGMFNYISGTVTNSVVHVTLPANITKTNGLPITNMSAIGQVSGGATVTNCQAFLTNNATTDTIHSVFQMANEPAVVSTKVELSVNGTYQLPAATAYVSSNSDVATVSESGLITAVSGGVATVTATVNGFEVPFSVVIWKEISTAAEFAAIYNDEASLSGYYKLVSDIEFEDEYLSNLVSVTDFNFNSAVFTGVLDGNGKHVSGSKNTARLFARLSGTIKNLTISGSYGVWGGAIADYLEAGGNISNVTVNSTILDTRFHDNNTHWGTRSASAMVNFIRGGAISNCVANVTIPENITVTGGHSLTSVAAIGTVAADAGAYSITGCTATLVNDKSADSIVLVGGIQNPVTVAPQSVTENE